MHTELMFSATRALVTSVLLESFHALKEGRALGRDWSIQGFGMLRTYLDDDKVWRLNLWHDALAVRGVSTIHDHPWDFDSLIVCGEFVNQRYTVHDDDPLLLTSGGRLMAHQRIRTGPGGGPAGAIVGDTLVPGPRERYLAGDVYSQTAEEVHESIPTAGTITLNKRVRRPDGEHANVFWPRGEAWVDAEPRMATRGEVHKGIVTSLVNWMHIDIARQTESVHRPSPLGLEHRAMSTKPRKVVALNYVNWRGVRKDYRILPHMETLRFGTTDYHTTPGWLFDATNADTGERRTFAMHGIVMWSIADDQSLCWR